MGYDVEVKDLPTRHVATIRVTTKPNRLGTTFGGVLPEVFAYLQERGIEPVGPSFGIFHEYGDEVDMEAGFPVLEQVPPSDRVTGRTLDAARFAVTWHDGSYASIGEAHRAIEEWIGANGRQITGPPWEVYWTGPADGVEPSEYRTEVGYPIR
ncbi:MAG: GyrI-like domain-containing protein [Actinomycetota bacterium]